MNHFSCSWCTKRIDLSRGMMCKCMSVIYCSKECLTKDIIIHDTFCKLTDPIELLRFFIKTWIQNKIDVLISNFELGIRVYIVVTDYREPSQEQNKDRHFFSFSPDVLRRRSEYERFYKIKTCMPDELISSSNYFCNDNMYHENDIVEKDVFKIVTKEDIYQTFMLFNKLSVLKDFEQEEGLVFVFAVNVKAQVTYAVMFSIYDTIENSI